MNACACASCGTSFSVSNHHIGKKTVCGECRRTSPQREFGHVKSKSISSADSRSLQPTNAFSRALVAGKHDHDKSNNQGSNLQVLKTYSQLVNQKESSSSLLLPTRVKSAGNSASSGGNQHQPQDKAAAQAKPAYDTRHGEALRERREFAKRRDELKAYAWEKAATVSGKDPAKYRQDKYGNIINWDSYGKNTPMGWEVDHIKPVSKGGTNHKNNLQVLQFGQNRSKSNKYPDDSATEPKGVSRYDLIKTDVDKRSSLVKNHEVLFNYDGTIDKRCQAVRSGKIKLFDDNTVDPSSDAVKSGHLFFRSAANKAETSGNSNRTPQESNKAPSKPRSSSVAVVLSRSNNHRADAKVSVPSTSDPARCQDGSLDMRFAANRGQDKYNSSFSPSYSSGGEGGGYSYSGMSSFVPSSASYHTCQDGSRDMRYAENRGFDKFG